MTSLMVLPDELPAASDDQRAVSLRWLPPFGIAAMSMINWLLRILTLGTYHFWGKTETRQRMWSAIRLDGEPLEYTGTGRELLSGFLFVFGGIMLPLLLLSFAATLWFGPKSGGLLAYQLIAYAVIFLLIGVGGYRAWRYRLSRTRWRGIRGAMVGSSWRYGWTFLGTALLLPLTLGWAAPWRSTKLQRILVEGMRFGNRAFTFDGKAGPLYWRFAGLWFGVLLISLFAAMLLGAVVGLDSKARGPGAAGPLAHPTPELIGAVVLVLLGAYVLYAIVSAWYRSGMLNHFAAHTHYEGLRFKLATTGPGLMWISVTNILATLLTFGILAPWAQIRYARYIVERTALAGETALDAIGPGAQQNIGRGEGLAQAFDFDGI